MNDVLKRNISVIGLGYVGLPVAVAFGQFSKVIGFDINQKRIDELIDGVDKTGEVISSELSSSNIYFTSDLNDLSKADFHIISVPTPIDNSKEPDLNPLFSASRAVGKILKKGDIVVYESTVYPGVTEDECASILQDESDLLCGEEFFLGYSPERINPGDKKHTFKTIKKVVSAQDETTLQIVADVYSSVIDAGVYKASSIKVAEAAKVIENTQRDLNIALMNELAILFKRMNIDTHDVIEAAGTKWNFLPFRPGLVGGHCIGVDPYYLTQKAIKVGYYPEIILAGRRLNDSMGFYVAAQVSKLMTKKRIHVFDANVLIMGLAFKENCPDLRNTRVVDLISEFESFNCNVDVYDPWVSATDAKNEYNIIPVNKPIDGKYDAIVIAVAHDEFKQLSLEQIVAFGKKTHVLFDIKYVLEAGQVDGRL